MFARLFRRLNGQRPEPTLANLRAAIAQLIRPEPCPYCYAYQRPPRVIGDHLARVHPLDAIDDDDRDAMDDLDDAINALVRRGTDTVEREALLASVLLAGSPWER